MMREACKARDRYHTYLKARRFVNNGGIFIMTVGYDEAGPSRPLLKAFGLRVGMPGSETIEPEAFGHFKSPYMEADGKRVYVRALRPVTDAATVYGSVSRRENEQTAVTYSTESLINAVGQCPQRVSTRYARGKIRIPSATDWTFAQGIEPEFVTEGER